MSVSLRERDESMCITEREMTESIVTERKVCVSLREREISEKEMKVCVSLREG